jgi:hypothetical protein
LWLFPIERALKSATIDIVTRAGDAKSQQILQKRLRQAVYELASGDEDEKKIRANARRLLSGEKGQTET